MSGLPGIDRFHRVIYGDVQEPCFRQWPGTPAYVVGLIECAEQASSNHRALH